MNENKYVSEDEIKAYLKSVMDQANMLDGITDEYFVNEMVDQMYAQLQYRLGAIVLSKVDDTNEDRVREVFDEDTTLDEKKEVLKNIIPNLDELITEAIKEFSTEYIDRAKALN